MEQFDEPGCQASLAAPSLSNRIQFTQILTKNDLQYQETPFKKLSSSYLAHALGNLNNAANGQYTVKISLTGSSCSL